VLAGNVYPEIRDELHSHGFRKACDYYDWWFDTGYTCSYDRVVKGVPIGKYTGFPVDQLYAIKSVGRYTSIANPFRCRVNHPLTTLSTSCEFFSEQRDIFDHYWRQEYRKKIAPEKVREGKDAQVTIGNDVWTGAFVFINASTVTQIGDGAVIGAGSVVTHDIPPYAIAYGAPARVQRYRYAPEEIEILLRVKWWEWEEEKIRGNAELFVHPERFFERFG
jgi:aminocyclitol acetyltransferase